MRVALARGERVPKDWLIDAEGNPTTDPADYVRGEAALTPFGGHKGYGLAFVLDILSGALSPAGCTRANSPVTGNALFAQAIRIDAFLPIADFKAEVGRFIDYVKSTKRAPGFDDILVPGERSWREARTRKAEGIPIEETTWEQICETAKKFDVEV